MNVLFFDEEIDSGSKCRAGHPLTLVSEGYAYCNEEEDTLDHGLWCHEEECAHARWWPWRLTPGGQTTTWKEAWIRSRNDKDIRAWVGVDCDSKREALDIIQQDIEAYRSLPFNEARERARLMPV